MTSKFLRRNWNMHSKLGKRRRKKLKWRKPKGRDNKMREKRRGYSAVVKIGYKKGNEEKSRRAFFIKNITELEGLKKDSIINLGKIGKRKKIEILKEAEKKGLQVANINIAKFLKKNIKKEKSKVEEIKQKLDKK